MITSGRLTATSRTNLTDEAVCALATAPMPTTAQAVATNFNGVRVLSPLRHELRMAGSVALATQDYSARFFANSARPDLVLPVRRLGGEELPGVKLPRGGPVRGALF